ncbi:hypothetical protein ACJ2CR_07935 [Myxococcus faecalis]|uniref:hypothetical protein n=1 Tax=Myxococcus faecalis TaxID=3115646 RepID=UPI0024C6385F|nr:hypothetical protein MFMH1_39530 [Myxococcus sp. MH1]
MSVHGEDGLVREVLQRARAGANQGRSTKSSEVSGCTHPLWQQTMNEQGLRGTASYPTFAVAVLGGLSTGEFGDWRQDYLATLIYGFYVEYNMDMSGGEHHSRPPTTGMPSGAVSNTPGRSSARRLANTSTELHGGPELGMDDTSARPRVNPRNLFHGPLSEHWRIQEQGGSE